MPKKWLVSVGERDGDHAFCCHADFDFRNSHNKHHMGVDRSLYLARQVEPKTTRREVKRVVSQCDRCQSIDPAPVVHNPGVLSVEREWERLSIDVTHYRNLPYLSVVDCGPSRFAIWRQLRSETAESIVEQLEQIMCERGPCSELLMDNALAFRSALMKKFLDRWGVRSYFRAAYRASGNGIVERHHRTIKTMAERGGISPIMAVFWYNCSPRRGQDSASVPHAGVYKYVWRNPEVACSGPLQEGAGQRVEIGDEVWVKPPTPRCTTQWKKGVVTGLNSDNNVDVDGMPRHILDLRQVVQESAEEESLDESAGADGEEDGTGSSAVDGEVAVDQGVEGERRYPSRQRRPPDWLGDYVV